MKGEFVVYVDIERGLVTIIIIWKTLLVWITLIFSSLRQVNISVFSLLNMKANQHGCAGNFRINLSYTVLFSGVDEVNYQSQQSHSVAQHTSKPVTSAHVLSNQLIATTYCTNQLNVTYQSTMHHHSKSCNCNSNGLLDKLQEILHFMDLNNILIAANTQPCKNQAE